MEINKQPIYPVEPWTVTETEFKMETNYRNETTFSLSNGYLGTRGTLEEGYDFTVNEGLEGNFINGFYESEPIRYGEWNYGFPTESQSLLNLPDLKTIRLFLDGEELDIRKGEVSGWRRTLHMDQGTVTRSFDWTSPAGRTVHVETVVLLSHKKADSYIHIDVEFGEGEGKIPVDSIAKRAEAYKPKEKVTYKMIKEYIEAKYGFKVHTAYIAEVKRNLGLPMYDAPNAVEELKQPRKHPTPEKVEAIKDALRYFAVI